MAAVVTAGPWWALLAGNTIALVAAMTYDWTVNAIGPIELTEYLGLAFVYGRTGHDRSSFYSRHPSAEGLTSVCERDARHELDLVRER